jgi:hypothetical protein
MRYKILLFLVLSGSYNHIKGQSSETNLKGTVSFISSQSVYVKFQSTSGISQGDTLFYSKGGKQVPALIVNDLSSASCACKPFPGINLPVGQILTARKKHKSNKPVVKSDQVTLSDTLVPASQKDTIVKKTIDAPFHQKITGSLSAYSYSNLSNTTASSSTQFRYNLSLDARHIGDSKISFNTYISFRHDPENWSEVKNNVFSALKIYSLSLGYDATRTTHLTIGRTINPKIASIGAMDGIQFEQSINRFSLGLLAGFRPDNLDYGFNGNLFQYGAYLALNSVSANSYSETSLAVMQQMNNSKTDRRFIYFQHSNSLIKNIYFLTTFEVDLFKIINDQPASTFDPTGLYLYLRYRMTKNLNISGSYDARKNITYYETYKSLIDRLLENEMRQSYRLQADYRITSNISLGVQTGYRYLKSDPTPSKNIFVYFNYYKIPGINISARLSGTYLESSYVNSKIAGINLSRDLFNGKFNADIGYHYMENIYPENKSENIQNIGEVNISWYIFKKTSLSANYEGTFEKQNKYTRLFLQIRQRF